MKTQKFELSAEASTKVEESVIFVSTVVEEQKKIEVESSQVDVPLGTSITFEAPKETPAEP